MLFTVNEVKTYTFEEFREIQGNRKLEEKYTKEDLNICERILEHIKTNKAMYGKIVLITAILLYLNVNIGYADSIEASIDTTFNQLINLIKSFAKWGCLGMGLKRSIEEMLSGANFKQASTAGIQYWLCFIFIQFYPKLFEMIKM